MSNLTTEQKRILLGLPVGTSEADILAAYEAAGFDHLYLTVDEYLERFGEPETLDLTADDATGQIDYLKLGGALKDSTEEVDAYLAGRYTLPLAEPYPGVIEGMVADLTRLRLHANAPPEEVRQRAADARTMLKDISKGVAQLPSASGALTPTSQTGFPAYSAPARRFSSDALDRYTSFVPR